MRMFVGANTSEKDAMAADLQADEGNDEARDRYQRSFWEPVPEGEVRLSFMRFPYRLLNLSQEAIVQNAIEMAKEDAISARVQAKRAKQDSILLTGRSSLGNSDQPAPRRLKVESDKQGRPPIEFIDVGGKFINVADRTRRLHESDRRKAKHK